MSNPWQPLGGANSASQGGGPGFLGTGQYVTQNYAIDPNAFQNPLGSVAPQLGSAINAAPGAGGTVTAATSPYTGTAGAGLGALAGTYGQMAAGQGPSLANVQAQQQGATNLAGAESMLGSARGAGSPAAAQLAAQNALAQGQQQVAQNAVQGRTAEELGALSAQGSTLGALGGLGQAQQGQTNQVAQGNQQVQQAAQLAQLQALIGQNQQQQQGAQAGQQLGVQQQLGLGQIGEVAYNNAAQANAKLSGSLLQGLAGLAGPLAL